MDEKSHLRTKFKTLRRNIDISKVSREICFNIRQFKIYQSAGNVMIFYPAKNEINLLPLLEDNKNFYFPRVNDNELQVCPYNIDTEFKKSSFNIYEPCSNPVSADILDLLFVPALCCDKNNYRLGYGGGFYDRFIHHCPRAVTIVPIYDKFIIDKLPNESFDECVDYVITNDKRFTL